MSRMLRIIKEGFLHKKSPKGIKGFRQWQKRYFVIDTKNIRYYKGFDGKPVGFGGDIPLLEIQNVEFLPDRRIGCRFDIKVRNHRTYCLHGDTPDEVIDWIKAIHRAIEIAKQDNVETKQESILDDKKYSQLQLEFFRCKFGESLLKTEQRNESEERKLLARIDDEFGTDRAVLEYLLTYILNPRAKLLDYDLKSETLSNDEKSSDDIDPLQFITDNNTPVEGLFKQIMRSERLPPERFEAIKSEFDTLSIVTVGDLVRNDDWHRLQVPSRFKKSLIQCIDAFKKQKKQSRNQSSMHHTGQRTQKQSKQKVAEMLKSRGIVRTILTVFRSTDEQAKGLAVRTLWATLRVQHKNETLYPRNEKANSQFISYISIYCEGQSFTKSIKDHIFALLLSTPGEVTQKLEPAGDIALKLPVKMHSMWQPLFAALKNSNLDIRKEALTDISSLLHGSPGNCESLRTAGRWGISKKDKEGEAEWQTWIYKLYTDIPKASKNVDPIKSVYGLTTLLLNRIHVQYFMNSHPAAQPSNAHPTLFSEILTNSIKMLHLFGGANTECQVICSTMLTALVNSIKFQKKNFCQSDPQEAVEWQNLMHLSTIYRHYVFQTAYWQTNLDPNFKGGNTLMTPIETGPTDDWGDQEEGLGEQGGDGEEGFNQGWPRQARGNTMDSTHKNSFDGDDFMNEAGDIYVLYPYKPAKYERRWDSETVITDFGIHWDEDGNAADKVLLDKLCDLFKALGVAKLDLDLMGDISKEEKAFRTLGKKEFEFWDDSRDFITLIKRQDISEKKMITYRKFSHITQEYLNHPSGKGRKKVIKLLGKIKQGEEIAESAFKDSALTLPDILKITNETKIRDILIQIGKETGNNTMEQYADEFEKQHLHVVNDLVGYPEWFEELQVPFKVRKKIKSKLPEKRPKANTLLPEKQPKNSIKKKYSAKPLAKISTKARSEPKAPLIAKNSTKTFAPPKKPNAKVQGGEMKILSKNDEPPPGLLPLTDPPPEPPSEDSSTDEEELTEAPPPAYEAPPPGY